MDYLEVEILHFANFPGKKVSTVVQSISPVHRLYTANYIIHQLLYT